MDRPSARLTVSNSGYAVVQVAPAEEVISTGKGFNCVGINVKLLGSLSGITSDSQLTFGLWLDRDSAVLSDYIDGHLIGFIHIFLSGSFVGEWEAEWEVQGFALSDCWLSGHSFSLTSGAYVEVTLSGVYGTVNETVLAQNEFYKSGFQ